MLSELYVMGQPYFIVKTLDTVELSTCIHDVCVCMCLCVLCCLCVCSRKDPGLSDALLSQVNSTLEESGYDLKSGRIITGQEEAVAGWVSSNYLSQGLQDEVRHTHTHTRAHTHTLILVSDVSLKL